MTLDLAIVCSIHNYGRYLVDWAGSILTLTARPALVAILEHGSTDDSAAHADAAAEQLRAGGFGVELLHVEHRLDLGAARNRAVEMGAGHAWVMHLDADDLIMPHALADVAALEASADVVAMGYRRCRADQVPDPRTAAVPQRADRRYRATQGESTLRAGSPASGCSPFRVDFWRQCPYRLDMIGGWDTAMWLDFAHLGARFAASPRPGFWYRQHRDSVFNTRVVSRWPAARATAQLRGARQGEVEACVVVPRGAQDGPERAAAWDWVRRRYEALHPAWPITEGLAPAGPWRKGAAAADGAAGARGRVMILADADCVLPPAALEEAVALVRAGAPWVVPHTRVYRLNEATTREWLEGPVDRLAAPQDAIDLARPPYSGFAGGGAVVVNRAVFEAAGGIPGAFVGWGAEDEALALILDTLVGRHIRLTHPLVHLWHPRLEVEQRRAEYRGNRVTLDGLRRAAAVGPEALWALVRGPGAAHLRGAAPTRQPARVPAQGNGIDFTRRRQATAHHAKGARMAGPGDVARQMRMSEAAQQARNKLALSENQARLEESRRRRALPPAQRRALELEDRRAKQLPDTTENKMLPASDAENKGARFADPHRRTAAAPPPPATDPLDEVPFASPQARQAADEAGLTAEQFAGQTPASAGGFTAAQVRELAES